MEQSTHNTDSFDAPLAPPELVGSILRQIGSARAVQLVGHVRPDGDCIGSLLGMSGLLEAYGKPHAITAAALPANGYDALAGYGRIREAPDASLQADLTIYLDCAGQERGLEDWTPQGFVVNIDHHESNTRFGQINWVEPRCAATGQMVYSLARASGKPISPAMAEALYVALSTDTGSFRFSNTGASVLRVAADLIELGAQPDRAARIAYGSLSPEGLRLTGHILLTARVEEDGRLAWSEIRKETYRDHGGERNAPENLADSLRTIRGVTLVALFHETDEGDLRLNLRSDGSINVGRLAAEFGGGGHACAAGATMRKIDYATQRDTILEYLRSAIRA